MQKSHSRRWTLGPGTSWLVYGGGLVVVLLCASILLYFNLWGQAPPEAATVVDLSLPLLTPAPAGGDGLAADPPDPAIDEAYRRAVDVQMEDLATRQADAPAVPTPRPRNIPQTHVELEVITSGANLNVRAAPGTQAPVISSVAPGTRLRAVAINAEGTWIQAHVPQLTEPGWLFAGLVQVVAGNLATLPTAGPADREDSHP